MKALMRRLAVQVSIPTLLTQPGPSRHLVLYRRRLPVPLAVLHAFIAHHALRIRLVPPLIEAAHSGQTHAL